jgi:hypothetical protein
MSCSGRGEVGRLCEGHTTETANEATSDDALLATEDANLETRVLRSLEHLVSMKTIEHLSHTGMQLHCRRGRIVRWDAGRQSRVDRRP